MEKVTTATAKGERPYQEDRVLSERLETPSGSYWLLAVFDGHGGADTAEVAARRLSTLTQEKLLLNSDDISELLRDIFRTLHHLTDTHKSGSTASVVVIPPEAQVAHIAVLGDSPIAIWSPSGRMHIAADHNIRTNRIERESALARGGVYRNGYLEDSLAPGRGLQMTRALGDADLSKVLSREPDIDSFPLGSDSVVLVGSDGLWDDPGDTKEDQLRRLYQFIQKGADAEALVKDAVERRTRDNVSAIVWRSSLRDNGDAKD